MNCPSIQNVNINSMVLIASPRVMQERVPQTPGTIETVVRGRAEIERILDGEDHRMLAVVGPCSIHNLTAAAEYARRLRELREEVSDVIDLVMRVYFEKPRSSLGWKGLINDPYMNDTFCIEEGLRMAREFLVGVAKLGLPAATEVLDTLMPQYIGDLISWSVIGARTSESQTHREIASGLSTPVGFKNATDGSFDAAINGMKAAAGQHHFLGVTDDGLPAVFGTIGNAYSHIVLRGGKKPNYDAASVAACSAALQKAGLRNQIMVDCSHGNSGKKPENQPKVLDAILGQREAGDTALFGFMLESNLEAGRQDIGSDPSALRPGCSVTDACIDWPTTERIIRAAAQRLRAHGENHE